MGQRPDDYKDAAPHADKPRMYQIGRWVTDCRLAKGWTMVDVAMRLHSSFPHSHLGNQGRISELETGNGVKRERWTPEIFQFLHSIFQPCPPPPEEPWELSAEYERFLREKEAAAEARRLAELARRLETPQLGLDLLGMEVEAPVGEVVTARRDRTSRTSRAPRRAGHSLQLLTAEE